MSGIAGRCVKGSQNLAKQENNTAFPTDAKKVTGKYAKTAAKEALSSYSGKHPKRRKKGATEAQHDRREAGARTGAEATAARTGLTAARASARGSGVRPEQGGKGKDRDHHGIRTKTASEGRP